MWQIPRHGYIRVECNGRDMVTRSRPSSMNLPRCGYPPHRLGVSIRRRRQTGGCAATSQPDCQFALEEVLRFYFARGTYARPSRAWRLGRTSNYRPPGWPRSWEILMVDLWHGCFRKNWLKSGESTGNLAHT